MPPIQRRHRSTVACQDCRRRKVRCSVTVTGVPCIRCAQDGTRCAVEEGNALPMSLLPASAHKDTRPRDLDDDLGIDTGTGTTLHHPRSSDSERHVSTSRGTSEFSHPEQSRTPHNNADYRSDPERRRDIDEEQSGAESSFAARGQGSNGSGVPFYTGEHPSITAVINDCSELQQPIQRHYLLSIDSESSLSEGDRQFLQYKGVFNLPPDTSCKELLRAYFHHVHPIIPILDAAIIPDLENRGTISACNLLLFWSMAVVAVNFVPNSTWQFEGYTSRKEMKDTLYGRAKCIYDNGGVTDKEVLLQSALLLSFWHTGRDSHSEPWHWSSIAISLCQIIGIHRNPDAIKFNPMVPPHRRHMWRRIWASCLYRDRWLSLTLGRPPRIHISDCDMPAPSVEDVLSDLSENPALLMIDYLPQDLDRLAMYWIVLLQASNLLGDVLSLCYQHLRPTPTMQQFENLESVLLQFRIPEIHHASESKLVKFTYYHVQLHYQALLITFYRPFVSAAPQHLPLETEEAWRNRIRSQIENAARHTNSILDCLAREELVGFAGTMTPPLLVPAMHVHLLNCKSKNPLTRRLGFNKLELCIAVMRELQKSHTSASVFCGIFGEAIRQVLPGPLDESIWGTPQGLRPSSTGMPSSYEGDSSGSSIEVDPFISDDVMRSLLDETSMYNFWQSMNMPEQSFSGYNGM